jgi:hypothetical protein
MDYIQKLRALAKLLPYSVKVRYKGSKYTLIGLDLVEGNNCSILNEEGPRLQVPIAEVKPILYNEDHLYKFIGEHLPAYEVARLAIDDMDYRCNFALVMEGQYPDHIICTNRSDKEQNKVYIFDEFDVGVTMVFADGKELDCGAHHMSRIMDYLHQMHFAVNWPEGEYINKNSLL